MGVRFCYVCDQPISKSEPRAYIGNLSIHECCDPDASAVKACDVESCAWRWTTHSGGHVV